MKRILIIVTAALFFSGVSYAQEQPGAKKKCGKECCKDKKDCKKNEKIASKEAVVKPVAVKPVAVKKAKVA